MTQERQQNGPGEDPASNTSLVPKVLAPLDTIQKWGFPKTEKEVWVFISYY